MVSIEEMTRLFSQAEQGIGIITQDWAVFNGRYWHDKKQIIANPAGKTMLKDYKERLKDYTDSKLIPLKELNKGMVNALYDRDITEDELMKFRSIICECLNLDVEDYEEAVRDPEEHDEDGIHPFRTVYGGSNKYARGEVL